MKKKDIKHPIKKCCLNCKFNLQSIIVTPCCYCYNNDEWKWDEKA